MNIHEVISQFTLKPIVEGVPLDEDSRLKLINQFYMNTRVMAKAAGAETELEYLNLMIGSMYNFIQHQTEKDLKQKHYYIEYTIEFMKKLQAKTPRVEV